MLARNVCRSREQVIDDRVVQCVAFLGPDLPGRVDRVLPVGGQAVGSCFLEACLDLGDVLGVLGVGERSWAIGPGGVCFGWLRVLVLPEVGDWRLAGAVRVVGEDGWPWAKPSRRCRMSCLEPGCASAKPSPASGVLSRSMRTASPSVAGVRVIVEGGSPARQGPPAPAGCVKGADAAAVAGQPMLVLCQNAGSHRE